MKKVILILLLVPAFVFAQKPVKPNLSKALSLWQEGKLGEAKDMIEAATTYEKTMNDGKTWYYRGLIYASIDTTSNATYKALSSNALEVAVESFNKADKMKAGKEYFVSDPNDPINSSISNTKDIQLERLANYYLDRGIKLIQQDEPDYMGSIAKIEKCKQLFLNAMPKYVNDTLAYYVLAISGQASENYDTAIVAANEYLKRGGKSKDVYFILYQIYSSRKDKEKALEVVRQGKKALPGEYQFSLMEIELLIDLGKVKEAKSGLEDALARDPKNKALHFYLGYVYTSENNLVEARKYYESALKIDPYYFEAQVFLAKIVNEDAKQVKRQINALGITAADRKKKQDLDAVYVQKLKVALPYWEKAEKLNASDREVLDELYSIYSDLGMEADIKRIQKRLKELGIED